MNTISNQTCTKCQNCGEWTNYAGDGQHRARMERLDEARETITRLNRRVQMAESGLAEKLKESAPGSLGRSLANAAAEKYMHERDEARAELLLLAKENARLREIRRDACMRAVDAQDELAKLRERIAGTIRGDVVLVRAGTEVDFRSRVEVVCDLPVSPMRALALQGKRVRLVAEDGE